MKLARLIGIGLIIILICIFASAAPKRKRASRKPQVAIPTLSTGLHISPAERLQILRSREFSIEQIEMARAMKWLLDYSGEELERELMRRKAKEN